MNRLRGAQRKVKWLTMTERGRLIVVSGPSGVGKDTILHRFLLETACCKRAVTATTRRPRAGEVHGRDYYFLQRDEFLRMAQNGEMLEYTEYNGNLYGPPKQGVQTLQQSGQNVILEIEVNGGLKVKKIYPEAVLVFIVAPSWQVLEQRLRNRGTESEEEIQARLKTARFELSQAHEYDYIIINDDLERCCTRLNDVISAAGCEERHMRSFIEEVMRNA